MTSMHGKVGYGDKFLTAISGGSYRSAKIALEVVSRFVKPSSVVDYGCGPGAWLLAAREQFEIAPAALTGVDGKYAEKYIKQHGINFVACDLRAAMPSVNGVDLAICLEVAEHLPATRAKILIENLTQAAPLVLFGAAFPGQGGTGHINEKFPDYWVNLFSEFGSDVFDALRPELWTNPEVLPWYAQNAFLFVRRGTVLHAELSKNFQVGFRMPGSAYHPGIFDMAAVETAGLTRYFGAFPARFLQATKKVIGRLIRK